MARSGTDKGHRILIVSTGRTGTRSLAEYLNGAHADVEAFHITPRSTLFNVLSNAWLERLLPTRAIDFAWTLLKHSYWKATNGQRIFVDSNNHLYAWGRHLMERYPDLRMVHVVRDPRTYVRSHLRWVRQRPKSWIANYLVPFWQPNAFLIGEAELADWWRLNTFERFCWIWDFKNRFLRDTGERFPERYLRLPFESLTTPDRDPEGIAQLEAFIGVPGRTNGAQSRLPCLNRTATGEDSPWAGLSDEQCRQLERLCGAQMRDYGYGNEPSWLARLS